MAFKSWYHLQSCQLPKLDTGGASVGSHDFKRPLSLLIIRSHAGYPSWTLEGRQLGVTTLRWHSNDFSREGTPNNTLTCIKKSSNTTSRHRNYYGTNKPSNFVITSNRIQHPQEIKQNIRGGVVKDGSLAKEGEWLKLCTSWITK